MAKLSTQTVIDRMKEPSTWLGVGAIGGIFGVEELAAFGVPQMATSLASVAALLAGIVMREKGRS